MYVQYSTSMLLTWIRSQDDLKWYRFKLKRLEEQFVLEVGTRFDVGGQPYEIASVEFSKSGLSGTLVLQSI